MKEQVARLREGAREGEVLVQGAGGEMARVEDGRRADGEPKSTAGTDEEFLF